MKSLWNRIGSFVARFFSKEEREKHPMSLRLYFFLVSALILVGSLLMSSLLSSVVNYLFGVTIEFSIYWYAILMGIVVGCITLVFVSKVIARPIVRLNEAMKKVSEGDFTPKLEPHASGIHEIRESYESFNRMTQELASTEILQTDFVSNVSHEFKTPINAIEGYTMLLQGTDTSDEQDEYVEKILYNTRRLSELVGSILLLSKLENKGIQNRFEFFCLDEQMRKAIVSLEHKWTAKNIEFDVEMETVVYKGNESLLYHVFANLIDNAIKFNRDGGKITVRLAKNETDVVASVSDEGPGVGEQEKNHIFDKFYQANGSHSGEGNGLGLALVKRIVDIHRGKITVENNQSGIGCTFTLTLPR